jgi:hypothetical protein
MHQERIIEMKFTAIIIFAAVVFVPLMLPQQKYPNNSTPTIILENEELIVQRIEMSSGRWVGEHPHQAKHLAVALDDIRMVFKEDGKEREVSLEKGDVIWSDPIESHDHMPLDTGAAILITLK